MEVLKCPSRFTRPRHCINLWDAISCAPSKLARMSLRTKLAMQPVKRHSTVNSRISMARWCTRSYFWKDFSSDGPRFLRLGS